MFFACITGRFLSPPSLVKGSIGALAAIGVDVAVPSAKTPDTLEIALLCQRFLVRRLMRFAAGDVITVDGEGYRRGIRHPNGRLTEWLVWITRILSIESRELMALDWDDAKAFEDWRARNKIRTKSLEHSSGDMASNESRSTGSSEPSETKALPNRPVFWWANL